MILARGSCRTHSRSIIPQLRATSGLSYLEGEGGIERDREREGGTEEGGREGGREGRQREEGG